MTRLSIQTGRGVERLPAYIALSIIPSLPRSHLERLVQSIVDHLDDTDGDADREDATDIEDDFVLTPRALASCFSDGPGCPVGDPGGQNDEDDSNTSFGEQFFAMHGTSYRGPGCPISDPDFDYLRS